MCENPVALDVSLSSRVLRLLSLLLGIDLGEPVNILETAIAC
jgi:hypothetical protein